jgi:hypothetical protein
MMNKKLGILLASVFAAQMAFAQIKVYNNPKANRPINSVQWEVNDLVYYVKKKVDDPHNKEVYAIVNGNAVIHNPFEQPDDFIVPHFDYFSHMRKLFESVHFENCEPLVRYNSSGYNLTNKKDGIVLMYTPKENQWVGANPVVKNEFDHNNATQQWFNTLTGEFTEEVKFELKELGF